MCSDDFCHQILLIKVLITRLGRYPLSVVLSLSPKLNNGKNTKNCVIEKKKNNLRNINYPLYTENNNMYMY